MTELYPVFFGGAVLLILSGLEILFFRLLNPTWWKKRAIRKGSLLLPAAGLVFIVVWVIGIFSLQKMVMLAGATLTALVLILIFGLLLSLPISGALNFIHDRLEKRKKTATPSTEATLPRRAFLKGMAAVVPAAALGTGVSGVFHALVPIRVHKLPIYFENLPEALEGFRILHISDIHIGYYVWLEDVERVLNEAVTFRPDIILATGDLSDRLDVYGDLLKMLDAFNAPHGVLASIGNHEYYRGFAEVRRIYDANPVPLLLNEGVTMEHRGTKIHIAGADDPKYLSRAGSGFYENSITEALSRRPEDAFTILLCHRPDGFESTARRQVDLTLSGHTHGGQIGVDGHSLFDSVAPRSYLWGLYEKGDSRLYTSAGMGHWFPFRLGCPAEAPVIELKRA